MELDSAFDEIYNSFDNNLEATVCAIGYVALAMMLGWVYGES